MCGWLSRLAARAAAPWRIENRARIGALFFLCLCLTAGSGPALADAAAGDRLKKLDEAIRAHPGEQGLLIRRARLHIDGGAFDLALGDIRAAEAAGDPGETAYVHGLLLFRTGNLAGARGQFDRYLLAHPGHRSSLEHRARILREAGDCEAALADYRKLMALSDTLDPGYYLSAARCLVALPGHGVDEALALIDARVAATGPVSSLQRYAVGLERDRGRYDAAILRLGELDSRLRATPEWQVEVAELLILAGRAREALPYLALAEERLRTVRQTAERVELGATLRRLREEAGQADSPPQAPQTPP